MIIVVFRLPVFAGNRLTVTDALGRQVQVLLPVRTVGAMNSDALEILRALNAGDMVSGVFAEIVRERAFWGKLTEKPKLGSWREADLEAIMKIKPDLVIAYERNPGPELEKRLKPLGIQVIRLNFYKIRTLNREIGDLGRILGREKQAAELCGWYDKHLGQVARRLKTVKTRPSVYVESYSDYHSTGPSSGADEMCTLAGGRNLAGGFSIPYPEVSPEWVVAQNPQIIVKAASWANGYEKSASDHLRRMRATIMTRPAFPGIDAVKSGRVMVMDSSIWTGPRAVVGILYLARLFHPGLFGDIDPETIHRDYIENIQKIPYGGVFAVEGMKR